MKKNIRELWLVVLLIILASSVLIFSDRGQRQTMNSRRVSDYPRIAIMQITATSLIDTHVAGVIDRLQSQGFCAPDKSNIRRFNAMGDFATANTIAREIASGPYDIVITSSTVALQVFSKANLSVRKLHIFGCVTDPIGAGAGILGPGGDQRPPYMAGIGSFQPVERTFRLLKAMNPGIKRVGVVWNPGEQCSEACLGLAHKICQELGIELIEAIATNTSEISEATRALVAQKPDAVWVGGDTVAMSSISLIINIAGQQGIPVFTNDPDDAAKGALFGLGANYYTVGLYTADIAIEILRGRPATDFRVENVVPELFMLNEDVFNRMGSNWTITPEISELIDASRASLAAAPAEIDFALLQQSGQLPSSDMLLKAVKFLNLHLLRGRPAKIIMINLVENQSLEDAARGIREGLQISGLQPGQDYTIKEYSAQGEPGQLPQIITAALQEKPDAIITLTTPALLATVQRVKDIPLIYSIASDPEVLGLTSGGRPNNLCGVHDNPPVAEVLAMARSQLQNLKTAGIIYDLSEENSLISVRKLRQAGKDQDVRIIESTATTVSDLTMATQSLIQRGAQTIIVSADNLVSTGFAAIYKAASASRIPIYTTSLSLIPLGATDGIGYSYHAWGKESGIMAAKVLAGVPPASLPLKEANTYAYAELQNIALSQSREKPFALRLVQYSDTEFAERCQEGLMDGLRSAGFLEGRDFTLKTYNAQGDMSTLSSIMTSVKADNVDLLMVISTPTLQAALRQAGSTTKIVFTGVGDAVRAGAGASETDHLPNVTGITTRSPFEGMASIIREIMPGAKRVGTLFTPAEINSVLYKDWLKDALQEEGIELVSIPVISSADLVQAASELSRQNIQAVCQVVDNLTRPGFAFIARKAAERNLPVFVFDSDQMKEGGVICLSRDYYDAGLEAAEKAARVLRGEHPSNIPFSNTLSEKLIINTSLAAKYGLHISNELLSKAAIHQ